MKRDPNVINVFLDPEPVDAFCEAIDPGGNIQYNEIFEMYENRINAHYDSYKQFLVFDTEQDKLAFLLKYS